MASVGRKSSGAIGTMFSSLVVVLFVLLVIFIVASVGLFLTDLLLRNPYGKALARDTAEEITADSNISSCGQCPVVSDAGTTWFTYPNPSDDESVERGAPERE
jgi:hypothetical protein